MELENKDIALGALLIGIVLLAGWVGFLYVNPVTKTHTDTDEETVYAYIDRYITEDEDPWGLPEDWSTAPNSTYITINNGTHVFQVSLGAILKGVALYQEQVASEEARLGRVNDYKNLIELKHILDPESGSYFSGVDILDILSSFDTNFAYDLSLVSTKTPDGILRNETEYFNVTAGEIIDYDASYEGDDTYMLALAMNKGWLINSPLGNYSFMLYDAGDDEIKDCLLNVEQINVLSTWEVKIMLNNTNNPKVRTSSQFTTYAKIDPSNMTVNEFTANYSYSNNDGWNFNRQYWGRNVSEIVNIAIDRAGLTDQNYTARFFAADAWAEPIAKGSTKELFPFNITDIEEPLIPTTREDFVNDPPEHLPQSDLLMCLCYAERELGEFSTDSDDPDNTGPDPVWPSKRINNYRKGPFRIIIPGRLREHYLKYVVEIRVTVFPGKIPQGYKDNLAS